MALVGASTRDLTCERFPVEVPRPDEQAAQDSPSPELREAIGLHAGKEWIDEVVSTLEKGKLPPPNPPTLIKGCPPIIDFRIGGGTRGYVLVR